MKASVKDAFLQVRDGFSPDRVVADPALNAAFVAACRQAGMEDRVVELNACLLNLRKAGYLPGLRSKKTSFRDQEEYVFASEIAVRFLERKYAVTLDRIICDPKLSTEFDETAAVLSAVPWNLMVIDFGRIFHPPTRPTLG